MSLLLKKTVTHLQEQYDMYSQMVLGGVHDRDAYWQYIGRIKCIEELNEFLVELQKKIQNEELEDDDYFDGEV